VKSGLLQTLSLLTFEEDVRAPQVISIRAEEDDELLSELTDYLSLARKNANVGYGR
jgi:hypothetical protein